MGNWIDISEQYVKSKNAIDCETHYFTFYYKNKENNLPTEEQDCIILGQREITKNSGGNTQITIPIDQDKAADAIKRVKTYHIKRQKDDDEEE